jgi:hypothetical protein
MDTDEFSGLHLRKSALLDEAVQFAHDLGL